MNTETPPSSPNLTGPCVMGTSLAFKAAIVAGNRGDGKCDMGIAGIFLVDIIRMFFAGSQRRH